jgi:hypothetical protein
MLFSTKCFVLALIKNRLNNYEAAFFYSVFTLIDFFKLERFMIAAIF